MLIYTDKLSGDEMFSDSYPVREIEDGFFFEVDGKWVELGNVDVDIGANPSAEDAEETLEEGKRKVVDIVDAFRLVEQPSYDKKAFMGYIKPWLAKVLEKLPEDQQAEFKAKSQPAIKFLISKLKDLQFFAGESMDLEGSLAFAYYREGASDPTFIFPKYALNANKC
ncbi:hypothetical protein WJX72_009903 [[Myrmecia] bisecta]|uniref:TCTP domain-containing protein n=1 Tax=[Myrmecia] bisecta TaxID=41462 RepID=A0AAW1QG64_9CHLO